jgi:hypothetical protein
MTAPEQAPCCQSQTYLSWGADEDGKRYATVECNAEPPGGDCGWSAAMDGASDGLTAEDLWSFDAQHKAWSMQHGQHVRAPVPGTPGLNRAARHAVNSTVT